MLLLKLVSMYWNRFPLPPPRLLFGLSARPLALKKLCALERMADLSMEAMPRCDRLRKLMEPWDLLTCISDVARAD